MVKMDIEYQGQLHCRLRHGPSGAEINTDAPKDNQGKGEAFSPTDLVAAALASCMATTMAIVAQRYDIELAGMKVEAVKEMVTQPARRIGTITVTFRMPRAFPPDQRELLERAARSCPVDRSLSADVNKVVSFIYP